MPITLYGAIPSPAVRSVLMTLKELGVEYNFKVVNFREKDNMTPEYLKMNPTHTVPTLDDNGFYLWESRAIMIYLYTKYGKDNSLYPKDPEKRAIIDQMLYFDGTALFPTLTNYLKPIFWYSKPPCKESYDLCAEKLQQLNTILEGRTFVAGDSLSLADLSLGATVPSFVIIGLDLKEYPNIDAWLSRIKKLPYYQEANQEGIDVGKEFYLEKLAEIQK